MKLLIENATINYVSGLIKPYAATERNKPKYGCDIIIEPDTRVYELQRNPDGSWFKAITTLRGAELALANAEWKDKGRQKLDSFLATKRSIRDGNMKLDKDMDIREGYANKIYVAVKSPTPVPAYNWNNDRVGSSLEVFYSGCRISARVDLYAMTADITTQGVFAKLTGIKFYAHGTRLDGGGVSADEFGESPAPDDGAGMM